MKKQVFLILDGQVNLSQEQFDRLKKQTDESWEKYHPDQPKPLILEGGFRVQIEEIP